MTIDEAIKHCLEVAEKNDGEAEVYGLLAKNHNNSYEKLTASRFHADCAECAADHRQLAKWLMELKEAKRLLKAAVEDFSEIKSCLSEPYSHLCDRWRYEAEALKLIGGSENAE